MPHGRDGVWRNLSNYVPKSNVGVPVHDGTLLPMYEVSIDEDYTCGEKRRTCKTPNP